MSISASRSFAAAGLAIGVALTLSPSAAFAAEEGLYGAQDPTFDGVYRQSLSLLALDAAGTAPAPAAVDWLVAQQCDSGGWTSYREDPSDPCAAGTEDSNATALAVQALSALEATAPHDATAFLRSVQNDDGGFSFNPGGDSDANSTSLVIGAFAAAGQDPAGVTSGSGNDGFDALADLQLTCSAVDTDQGAFDYSTVDFTGSPKPALEANDFATVQAVPGILGLGVVFEPIDTPVAPTPTCPTGPTSDEERAVWGADYLQRKITANPDGPFLPSAFGAGADFGSTANAVLAFAATGVGAETSANVVTWLAGNSDPWVVDEEEQDRPAALASLILGALATGADPGDFGGTDLVARLAATGPAVPEPTASPSPSQSPSPTDPPTLPDTGADSTMLLTLVLAGVALAGTGAGLMALTTVRGGGGRRES